MTKKQKFEEVIHAMRYTGDGKENSERAEIYLIDDKLSKESEVRAILMRNIWDDRIGGAEDLSYEICARACGLIADNTDGDDLENTDIGNDDIFYDMECASVYTAERLGYLNIWNESEISDKMKELGIESIQTACAVWYDDMVRSVALELRDYILKED
jgi:hypothetical protein